MPCVNCGPHVKQIRTTEPDQEPEEESEFVREYVKETVVIDGVTVIRKVREIGCPDCHLHPFGLSLWAWGVILGGTVLTALIFK